MVKDVQERLRAAREDDVLLTTELQTPLERKHALTAVAPVSMDELRALNEALLARPEGFTPNSKLERILERRREALDRPGGIDWGLAESLAFASILADGTPIRLSGQDAERGTFSQRHAVLHDQRTGQVYIPLQHL